MKPRTIDDLMNTVRTAADTARSLPDGFELANQARAGSIRRPRFSKLVGTLYSTFHELVEARREIGRYSLDVPAPLSLALDMITHDVDSSGMILYWTLNGIQSEKISPRKYIDSPQAFAVAFESVRQTAILAQLVQDTKYNNAVLIAPEIASALLEGNFPDHYRSVEHTYAVDVPIPSSVIAAASNLAKNAARAICLKEVGSRVDVTITQDGPFYLVSSNDDGPGMPEEQLERVLVQSNYNSTNVGGRIVQFALGKSGVGFYKSSEDGKEINAYRFRHGAAPEKVVGVAPLPSSGTAVDLWVPRAA